jgi:hypothetical protein
MLQIAARLLTITIVGAAFLSGWLAPERPRDLASSDRG